jgi:hypothetical protein
MKIGLSKYAFCAALACGFARIAAGQDADQTKSGSTAQAEDPETGTYGQFAAPPKPFGGNMNYYLNSVDCKPIRDVKVEIEITEALRSRSGLGFQLNAHTLKNEGDAPVIFWQQYMMGITVKRDGKIVIHDATQNWGRENPNDKGRIFLDNETDVFDLSEATIPAGARFLFKLRNDERGNIVGAEYTYVEPNGKKHPLKVDLKDLKGYRANRIAPIGGYQMDIVGPNGSHLDGGKGIIRYDSSTELVAYKHGPACTATHVYTAENINSKYSKFPSAPAVHFEQTFEAGPTLP